MSQPLTRWRSSSSKIATYSPYEQQVYKSLCKQAHEQYPIPSAKVNRKIIRTSIKTISSRTGINRFSVRRALDTLHEGGFVSYYKTKARFLCMYISQPSRHRVRPRFYYKEQVPPSKRPKELEKSRVGSVSLLREEEVKGNRGDQRGLSVPSENGTLLPPIPRPYSFLSHLRRLQRDIKENQRLFRPKFRQEHDTWSKIGPSLYHVRSDGLVDLSRPVVATEGFDGIVEAAVALTREASENEKLDEGWLVRRKDGRFAYGAGRGAMLEHFVAEFNRSDGNPEQRISTARRMVLKNVKGYLERQHKRRAAGLRCYWSLSNIYQHTQNRETKRRTVLDDRRFREDIDNAWKFDRRRNQDWHSHGRHVEATKTLMAKEAMHKIEVEKSDVEKNRLLCRSLIDFLGGAPPKKKEQAFEVIKERVFDLAKKEPDAFKPPTFTLSGNRPVVIPAKPHRPVDRYAPPKPMVWSMDWVKSFDWNREDREREYRRRGCREYDSRAPESAAAERLRLETARRGPR